jgi:predicted GIY-YIG superfamily endonuclease
LALETAPIARTLSDKEPTTVDLYRFYNNDNELLYIGISLSAAQRASQHKKTQGWWRLVARMDVEHLDCSRSEIEAIERDAIKRERPRFNIVHNTNGPSDKNAVWTCGLCGVATMDGYLQVANREDRSWEVRCKRCDSGAEIYFIDLKRIATYDDVAVWTRHLHEKVWFDINEWESALRNSCRIRQWVGAVLDGRDAYVQRRWYHRQAS